MWSSRAPTEGLLADAGSDSTGSGPPGIPKCGVGSLRGVMQPTSVPVTPPDVQAQRPTVHVSLSRVGVTNVEKVIRISRQGREELYWAKLECFVDLGVAVVAVALVSAATTTVGVSTAASTIR